MVKRPIYGIFQGGGAKGLAHVGALAAVEEEFAFVGVAGTSAGALVACLIAAGFSSRQLMNIDKAGDDILTRNGQSPIGLLGQKDWKQVKRLMDSVGGLDGRLLAGRFGSLPILPGPLFSIRRLWTRKGLLSTRNIETFLNDQLRARLADTYRKRRIKTPVPERVTFADLDYERFPEEFLFLKIIGTNVSRQGLCVFDKARTPHVEVARAVAASIAIPGVFEPVAIQIEGRDDLFVDGGLVSNLPVWVFAKEKLRLERHLDRQQPIPILAFTLKDGESAPTPGSRHPVDRADAAISGLVRKALKRPERPQAKDGLLTFMRKVGQTSLSGGQSVIHEFLEDMKEIPLETSLTLLDFDVSAARLRQGYLEGYACAKKELAWRLIERPKIVNELLETTQALITPRIKAALFGARSRRRLATRLAIAEPIDHGGLRVTFAHGAENDADDRMTFEINAPGPPKAFLSRDVAHDRWDDEPRSLTTKYDRALLRGDIRSSISIPIFADLPAWDERPAQRPQPQGVLVLDSDQDLSNVFADHQIMSLLVAQSLLFYQPIKAGDANVPS